MSKHTKAGRRKRFRQHARLGSLKPMSRRDRRFLAYSFIAIGAMIW